jgi:prepilin-type N-terminal cleavage/methylation domain-containing protein
MTKQRSLYKDITSSGFTLVELAIAMIIIGLLIGGIFKGQEIIKTAKNQALISQAQSYASAIITFRDTYGGYPGDSALATQRLPNCDGINCLNGNGDSIISGLNNGAINVGAQSYPFNFLNMSNPANENVQAWRHLEHAGLITGVQPQPIGVAPAQGESHPRSKARGVFHIRVGLGGFDPWCQTDWSGTWLRNTNQIDQPTWCLNGSGGTGDQVISPISAEYIDQKIDDGVACQGDFRAISVFFSAGCNMVGGGAGGACGPLPANAQLPNYAPITQKNCMPMWRIE